MAVVFLEFAEGETMVLARDQPLSHVIIVDDNRW